jgi:hypothetical protein
MQHKTWQTKTAPLTILEALKATQWSRFVTSTESVKASIISEESRFLAHAARAFTAVGF